MDIYLCERDTFERLQFVDEYKSIVWTERPNSPGDVVLQLPMTDDWVGFSKNRFLENSESDEIMIIEERFETTNEEGENVLEIRGRTLDTLMERRAVIPTRGKPNWPNYGPIREAVNRLVDDFMLKSTPLGFKNDIIPNLYTYFDINDMQVYDIALPPQELYTAIKSLCDSKRFSFGIDLNKTNRRMRFYCKEPNLRNIYFSTQTDTLSNPSFLDSNAGYYNVAYVWSREAKYQVVVGGPNADVSGVNRRVLTVDASDLDVDEETTMTQMLNQMRQRGREELAKHRQKRLFDGKVENSDVYKYRTHYDIGDMVNLIDDRGNTEIVRVTEFIYSQDSEGLRMYPTFTSINEEGEI